MSVVPGTPILSIAKTLSLVLFVTWTLATVRAEQWTDVRGERTIDAELVGLWGDRVILKTPEGRRISVPMSQLQASSRLQAERRNQVLRDARQSRIAELKRAAEMGSAPAPDPLPQPPDAPVPPPVPINQTPQKWVDWANEVGQSGRLLPNWQSLPPPLQTKVAGAVQKYVAEFGAAEIKSLAAAMHTIGQATYGRQNWFVSQPRFKDIPPSSSDALGRVLNDFGGGLYHAFDPQHFDVDALASGDVAGFLQKLDDGAARYFHLVADNLPAGMNTKVELRQVDGKNMLVQSTPNGGEVLIELVEMDGYFVPQPTIDVIDRFVAAADNAAALKGQLPLDPSLVATMVSGWTGALMSAPDETAYHEALESMIAQVQPMVGGLSNMLPPGMGLTGDAGASSFAPQPGYASGASQDDLYRQSQQRGAEDQQRMQQEAEQRGREESMQREMEQRR